MIGYETSANFRQLGIFVLLLISMACKSQSQPQTPAGTGVAISEVGAPDTQTAPHVNPEKAMQYTRQVVEFGPRYLGSAGHKKTEEFLRSRLKGDNLEEDAFTASTPAGNFPMRNFIAKFPGTQDGIIVIAGHYDTLYSKKN